MHLKKKSSISQPDTGSYDLITPATVGSSSPTKVDAAATESKKKLSDKEEQFKHWMSPVKIAYIIINFWDLFYTVFGMINISGVSSFDDYTIYSQQRMYYVQNFNYWLSVGVLGFVGGTLLLMFFIHKDVRNWWQVSIFIERIKEVFLLKYVISLIVLITIGSQIWIGLNCYFWNYEYCEEYYRDYNTGSYGGYSTGSYGDFASGIYDGSGTIAGATADHLWYGLDKYMCEGLLTNKGMISTYWSNLPARNYKGDITQSHYANFQDACYQAVSSCSNVCLQVNTVNSYVFTVLTCIYGLLAVLSYNGITCAEFPMDDPVFRKIKLPKWTVFSCPCFFKFSLDIPVVWSGSSDILDKLSFMAALVSEKELSLSDCKKIYASYPWDWTSDFTTQDYVEANRIFSSKSPKCKVFKYFEWKTDDKQKAIRILDYLKSSHEKNVPFYEFNCVPTVSMKQKGNHISILASFRKKHTLELEVIKNQWQSYFSFSGSMGRRAIKFIFIFLTFPFFLIYLLLNLYACLLSELLWINIRIPEDTLKTNDFGAELHGYELVDHRYYKKVIISDEKRYELFKNKLAS